MSWRYSVATFKSHSSYGVHIVHSCTDVRVTKVFRYIEQRDVLIDKDAGEGMPQVVKADVPHAVLLKHL